MKKLLIISVYSIISFAWISVLAGVYPYITTPQIDTISAPVTLLLLGTVLCVVSYWRKRNIPEE